MAGRILTIGALCLAAVAVLWYSRTAPEIAVQMAQEGPGAARGEAEPSEAAITDVPVRVVEGRERLPIRPPAATGAGCVLTVTVRDTAGEPVGDWLVLLEPSAGELTARRSMHLRTGPDGRASRKLEPGVYEVDTFGRTKPGSLQVELQDGSERAVELIVNRPIAVCGRVFDPSGQPAPFARILMRTESVRNGSPVEVARADAGGGFLLRTVNGAFGMVSATADGYRASEEQIVSAKRIQIELRLGADPAVLHLLIQRADGTPASSCWARVQSGGSAIRTDRPVPAVLGALRESSCDAQGRCNFTDLWPGRAQLSLREPGQVPHVQAIDLAAGTETFHRIRLSAGATLAGTVRDESGAPIAGAVIGGRSRVSTRSARDGTYELDGLDPAVAGIEAKHSDYETAETVLALAPGARSTWDPVLRDRPRIRGRLVDAAGAPLPRYMVLARDMFGHVVGLVSCAGVTGADGRFQLRPERRSTFSLHVYDASRGGRMPFPSQPEGGEAVVPGDEEVQLRLTVAQLSSAGIRGRLVLPAGLTPERVQMTVHHWLQDGSSHEETIQGFDAASGAFQHGPVPPGEYSVRLVTGRPSAVIDDLIRFTLVASEQRDLGDLVPPELGSLEVSARMAEGDLPSPPSVDLTRIEDGRVVPLGRCDEAGRLVVLLPGGRYRVRVAGSGFLWAAKEIAIAAEQSVSCRFTLEPASVRDLHFVLPAGEESCRYEVRRSGVIVLELVVRKASPVGGHGMPSLAVGRYDVLGIGSSGRRYAQSFTIERLELAAGAIRIDPSPIR